MEWLEGRHTERGLCVTTGMAQRSARRSSCGTASAKIDVMIRGHSAATVISANIAIVRGSG